MEDTEKMESHLSSAAAFVEGGTQDACDDACSICLEAFCDSDPSTVTGCKHEFHLQCILEWCQRSAQCPMCWQSISLKDPTSQELLDAVERERNIRSNQTRNTTIFHHPSLGNFELQHLPVGAEDADLEDHIIQHLAAAAAMGRSHHLVRREGYPGRPGTQGRPQFMVFSRHPNANSSQRGEENEPVTGSIAATPSAALTSMGENNPHYVQHIIPVPDQVTGFPHGTSTLTTSRPSLSSNRISTGQSSPVSHDRAGPSDLHTLSESLKSRMNSVSMRYKESITKSTRGWKERWFSRGTSVADLGSEVRREVNAGIATVSRMMERLDTSEKRASASYVPQNTEGYSVEEPVNERVAENQTSAIPNSSNSSASAAAASGPT